MSRNGVPIGNFRPNIAVTAVWPAGTVPKLRPHCLPPSFSRVAASLFSMPSVPVGFMCPDLFLRVPFFSAPCPKCSLLSLFVCVLITTHTHAHTPDSTSDCHIYYQVMLPGLEVVSMYDNLMSYQIVRLTVLSTIKLRFPDSKLYLCMCRVIYFCQLLMWKAGHIRFYV